MTDPTGNDRELAELKTAYEAGGRRFWQSLEQLAQAPDFRRRLEAEFPALADLAPMDRRTALKLMGASLALAGLTGCGEAPSDPIVSRAHGEPGHTPGIPLFYATTLTQDGYGLGVLVESHEGRPTKVEGNPLHPASLGATDSFAQAEILSLYDPDRSRRPLYAADGRPIEDAAAALAAAAAELEPRRGAGLTLLTGPTTSPSVIAAMAAVQRRLPEMRWRQFAPVARGNAYEGARQAFGAPVETIHDLAQADVIVAFDADFDGPGRIPHAAGFAAGRRAPLERLSRVYAAETTPGLLGARADRRVPATPQEVARLAYDLAAELGLVPPRSDGAPVDPVVPEMARDLRAAAPRALVMVGDRQPAEVHALGQAINLALGAVGTTLRHVDPILASAGDPWRDIAELAAEIAAGSTTHLVVLGANPAYTAPADLHFPELLRRVPFSLHVGLDRDETAALCRWHVPLAHEFESWGDARAFDGTISLMQPLVAPRHPAWTMLEALSVLAGHPARAHDILQSYWRGRHGEDFERFWLTALHDGIIPDSAAPVRRVELRPGWQPRPPEPSGADGLTIAFAPDPSVWDGHYANNAWLQELPKPLTKIVWGNAVLMAPSTAGRLGLANGDVVEVSTGDFAVRGPVWHLPGHAPDCVTLPLGYGRTDAGYVGTGVGFNAYAARRSEAPWFDRGTLRPTGERDVPVTTQQVDFMGQRDPVKVFTLAELRNALPGLPRAGELRPSIYPEYAYPGYAWGMAIDLNACIGCNACVVACQSENNIPVVGKEEVDRGREMHWLRIDRYWAGEPDAPGTYFQPMLCQHCEKAPCEVVCPVNATVHDSEGLNVMVYNRCIGTRFCSNNCPYKVRRFNWFDYTRADTAPPAEAYNPEVTVRDRGVMEKCTYCVQRISAARIQAEMENRPIRDGDVVTACQQACPTRAIVFGDINDPDTAVSRAKASPLDYAVLADLNTQPRTTYEARVDNPPDADGDRS